jgi:hypothetical protein
MEVNYQLKLDGNNLGGATAGTGSGLDFGKQTTPGTYTIVATSTATPACTETMTGNVVVVVNQPPKITTNAQPNVVCEGQPINLSTTPNVNGSYAWTGPNGFTSISPTPAIANATTTNSGVYNVTVIDQNGCKQTGSTTASVTPKPIAKATANSPICEGQTLRLAGDDAGKGAVYSWSGPDGFVIKDQQNPVIDNINTKQSGTYELTVSKDGCVSSVQFKVIVNQNPVAQATTDSPVCEGEKLNLSAENAGIGAVYKWTGPVGFVSNIQNPSTIGSLASAGKYVLVVTQNGCTSSDSVRAIVRPRPKITIPTIAPICEGQLLTISATTDPSATGYSWSGPNGFVSPEQNAKIEKATVSASGTYQLTASLDGCSASANTTVTVNAKPKAVATATPPTCEGTTILLAANDAGTGAKYSWTGPDSFSSITPNNTLSNVVPTMSGIYKLTVTLGQCSDSDTALVVVYPKPTLKITSATCTPNLKSYSAIVL